MKIKAELLQLEKRVDSLRAREDDAALQRSRAVAASRVGTRRLPRATCTVRTRKTLQGTCGGSRYCTVQYGSRNHDE